MLEKQIYEKLLRVTVSYNSLETLILVRFVDGGLFHWGIATNLSKNMLHPKMVLQSFK